jgi:hypothetical protein
MGQQWKVTAGGTDQLNLCYGDFCIAMSYRESTGLVNQIQKFTGSGATNGRKLAGVSHSKTPGKARKATTRRVAKSTSR